jgi:hypothetical protein
MTTEPLYFIREFGYWEKRRLIFNGMMLLSGLFLIIVLQFIKPADLIGNHLQPSP